MFLQLIKNALKLSVFSLAITYLGWVLLHIGFYTLMITGIFWIVLLDLKEKLQWLESSTLPSRLSRWFTAPRSSWKTSFA